jgi:tetratricopeptide (TPR) repeat protein
MLMTDTLVALAESVADGQVPDWEQALGTSTDEAERQLIRCLRDASHVGWANASLTSSGGVTDFHHTPDMEPGARWGSLEIREIVGRGRFGTVYRAWDAALARDVALKILHSHGQFADQEHTAVVTEGRLMARVRHPNVATIFGAQTLEGVTGLWMEFVDGRTLEAELRDTGPAGAGELIRTGLALGDAIAAVHDAGLVHRDIKAQNVLRADDGRLVLGDFGTGRELDPDESSTGLAGTPAYLAPEIFAGHPASPRSDLYSLGALLFHLATGTYPVSSESVRGIRDAHAAGRRQTLRSARPDLPDALAQVIDRAMEPDPARRDETVHDFVAALRSVERPPQLGRHLAAGAAAAVVALLAVWWGSQPPAPSIPFDQRDSVLVTAFDNRTGNSDFTGVVEYALERELANSSRVNVVPRDRIEDALRLMKKAPDTRIDAAVGREVALRDGGVGLLIAGRLEREGSQYVVTADVIRTADGGIAASVRQRVPDASAMLGGTRRLAVELRHRLGDQVEANTKDALQLPHVTTTSLPALRLYAAADEALNAAPYARSRHTAETLLHESLAADPAFAAAHLLMAQLTLDRPASFRLHLAEARRGAAALSEVERLLILGRADQLEGNIMVTKDVAEQRRAHQRAAVAFEAVLQLQPNRYEAIGPLVFAYRELGRRADARQLQQRLAHLRPASAVEQIRAARSLLSAGDVAAAEAFVRRARALGAGVDPVSVGWLTSFDAAAAWLRGDLPQALAATDSVASAPAQHDPLVQDQVLLHAVQMYLALGRLEQAEETAARLTSLRALARGYAYSARDDRRTIRSFLRHEVNGPADTRQAGSLWIDAGLLGRARPVVAAIGTAYVRGQLALAEGRYAEAIRELELASAGQTETGTAVALRAMRKLAAAYVASDQPDRAVRVLEVAGGSRAVAAANGGGFEWLSVRSELARMYAARGRGAEARSVEAELARLLELADEDHPIKRRLAHASPPAPTR